MIDPSMFDRDRLVKLMLDSVSGNVNKWLRLVEIVPNYLPPFPGKDTRTKTVVRCLVDPTQPKDAPGVSTFRYSYLRSGLTGWRQGGYFWDGYGDDFINVENALLAVICAPVPPSLLKPICWDDEA